MMQQYQSIRRSLPKGTLLLFRLGDFYELFFDDAKLAADILGVALTKRNGMPMCGVPFHAAEAYIGKLIKAGHRVAICDQVSEPQPGKIVERKVSQIISPGTVSDLNLLESKQNNFLAAINYAKNRFGLALVDVSTGEFRVAEMDSRTALQDELARFSPTELIRPDTMDGFAEGTVHDGYAFEIEQATELLREQFQVQSLDGFGCASLVAGVGAAGAVIHYLKNQLRRSTEHIRSLGVYLADEFVALDATTHSHLELVGKRDDRRDTSLLRALDRTVTPMGARLLRESILKPLRNLEKIRRRQELVARFLEQPFLLNACRESMRGVRDVERTLSRVSQGTGGPRDLAAIRHSLEALPPLVDHLNALEKAALFAGDAEGAAAASSQQSASHLSPLTSLVSPSSSLCHEILRGIHLLPELLEQLCAAIVDEPPATIKEGGIFRSGYDPDLDELRQMSGSGKEWIAELQQKEVDRTGIKSLKVRYNSVFGYFIEITKANLNAVPADYIRKQTTVNGERFITPELKEFEAKVLGADERAKQLEYQLFLKLREATLGYLEPLQETARAVAQLDLIASLAETARLFGYCQPEVNAESSLHIVEGRHPVLDQNLTEEKFVPNDCLLDGETNRLLLITGPNMAGKSTYIRQVALLVLMAQIGSFIPAKSATVGIVDRIFTRVGASDDLARGQSTFMVEMNETANIVNNASERSLIILDEIGRGTSTFDGLSIAWSVAEYLHDVVRARTLFATHYHEMTELEMVCAGVKNFNVAVREWDDRIIFLRKIQKGAADKSYGIQVARLAGLPAAVIDRAKEILANLESAELNAQGRPRLAEAKSPRRKPKVEDPRPQPTLFDFQPGNP
ncbi:MAG: DNA mismatch repair protein MutS [Verrucomicrobia bacterium]|nr:DNA mismatch repair protein MutS [Verrucomicrobiota bacterium]